LIIDLENLRGANIIFKDVSIWLRVKYSGYTRELCFSDIAVEGSFFISCNLFKDSFFAIQKLVIQQFLLHPLVANLQ
jgi:hypothetical protein